MQIKILEQIPLGSVPSASGIVVCGDFRYAIGDDSPFLHELDANLKPLRQFRLMDSEAVVGGRIRKSQKADLEAMELINGNEIVIFGSGSRSPQRDVFIQVNLNAELDRKHYHIGTFYDHLRSLPIMEGSGVNIEAAAFHDGNMLLSIGEAL
jgi:hypothetical protein